MRERSFGIEKSAEINVRDSDRVQKEGTFLGVPHVLLRDGVGGDGGGEVERARGLRCGARRGSGPECAARPEG